MFKEALRIGLGIVMRNHVYRFDNCIRQQQKGGPIGLELTGNIAQVFMIWWDQQLKLRLGNLGLLVAMYKRYVDDINIAAREVPLGTRYIDGELILDEDAIEIDRSVPGDKRTMEIIKCVGNDIHPSIQLEVDCPSNYDDGKLPILDLKVWIAIVNGCSWMVHEFYSKDISSKAVVHATSRHFSGNKSEQYLPRKYCVLFLTAQKTYHGRPSSNMSKRWSYGYNFRVIRKSFVTRLSTLR